MVAFFIDLIILNRHSAHWEKTMKIIGAILVIISAFIGDDGKEAFVDIGKTIPSIKLDVRYAVDDNFVGKPIDGYNAEKIFITREAAVSLRAIQEELQAAHRSLKIFDGYRPQRGVDHFVRWSTDPSDTLTKAKYYPGIRKDTIIPLGYVAEKSGHSRGSTLDLTIVGSDGIALDMGYGWDHFGPESHVFYKKLTQVQIANRMTLRDIMIRHGFEPYDEEWWHFTLRNEPYPDTYFDFIIE